MAFFRDPGEMFLGCLGTAEQRFLVTLIQTAAKSGYTRFVEPCAGAFAMSHIAAPVHSQWQTLQCGTALSPSKSRRATCP